MANGVEVGLEMVNLHQNADSVNKPPSSTSPSSSSSPDQHPRLQRWNWGLAVVAILIGLVSQVAFLFKQGHEHPAFWPVLVVVFLTFCLQVGVGYVFGYHRKWWKFHFSRCTVVVFGLWVGILLSVVTAFGGSIATWQHVNRTNNSTTNSTTPAPEVD